MPMTLRSALVKIKGNNGEYTSVDVVANESTDAILGRLEDKEAELEAAIQAKGEETLDSIPDSYEEIQEEIDDLKGALDDAVDELKGDLSYSNVYDLRDLDSQICSNTNAQFEQGAFTSTDPSVASIYDIRTSEYFDGNTFIVNPGKKMHWALAEFTNDNTFVRYLKGADSTGAINMYKDELYYIPSVGTTGNKYRLRVNTGDRTVITPNDNTLFIFEKSAGILNIENALESCISSKGISVTSNNYSSILTNANNAEANKVVYISPSITAEMIANLPSYGFPGLLMTYAWSYNLASQAQAQIYVTTNGKMYYRMCQANIWRKWERCINDSDIEILEAHSVKNDTRIFDGNLYKNLNIEFQQGGWKSTGDTTSLKDIRNSIGEVSNGEFYLLIRKDGYEWACGYFNQDGSFSRYIEGTTPSVSANFYTDKVFALPHIISGSYRFRIRNIDGSNIIPNDEAIRIYKRMYDPLYKDDLFKVIHSFGIIGDSLSVGWIQADPSKSSEIGDLYRRNEQYSWGGCIARESGANVRWLGQSGYNTQMWLNNAETYHGITYGVNLLQHSDYQLPVYILCLGYNDASTSPSIHVDLGTIADIGTDQATFYGGYAAIIQACKNAKSDCRIICFTMPNPNTSQRAEYNNAIRNIINNGGFTNVYLLDLDDLFADYYKTGTFISQQELGGHYTAIGYQAMSKLISQGLSKVIYDNWEDFKYINYI